MGRNTREGQETRRRRRSTPEGARACDKRAATGRRRWWEAAVRTCRRVSTASARKPLICHSAGAPEAFRRHDLEGFCRPTARSRSHPWSLYALAFSLTTGCRARGPNVKCIFSSNTSGMSFGFSFDLASTQPYVRAVGCSFACRLRWTTPDCAHDCADRRTRAWLPRDDLGERVQSAVRVGFRRPAPPL